MAACLLLEIRGWRKRKVIALDARDGQKIWTSVIGKVGPNEGRSTRSPFHAYVNGDWLFALGSDGDLACLEAKTGKIIWAKNLRRDFGGKPGMWAYAESPLVDGEALILSPGGSPPPWSHSTIRRVDDLESFTCRRDRGQLFIAGRCPNQRRQAIRLVLEQRRRRLEGGRRSVIVALRQDIRCAGEYCDPHRPRQLRLHGGFSRWRRFD